jgi:hypothetical protein
MNDNNDGIVELHGSKRVQRGNPVKYSIYTYHSLLKDSLYKKFIFIIPTMDCFALFAALTGSQ